MKLLAALLFLTAQQQLNQTIVVTASELPETIESTPAAVTVITRKQIDERTARDVADVLREVPGLTLERTGSPGKATSLFARGSASTQTLVLWNGIEINNPYFSGYDWGRFSTASIEQIEVVRGPFSALYGSEAMAGVINVLTTPRASHLRAEVQSGSHGLRNGAVDGAWVGGSLLLSGAAEHRQDDGFSPNDDFHQNTASVLAKWSPLAAFSIGVEARRTSYDLGIPFNTNADATRLVPSLQRRQDGTESQVAMPLTFKGIDLTLSEGKRRDNFRDPEDPFTTFTRTDSRSRRARLTMRSGVTLAGTIVGGGEYERQTVTDTTNFGPNFADRRRTDRALFVEDRYAHAFGRSRLELSAGIRNDRFSTFGSQTSPRLAAAWIANGRKFRLAYGEGFRAPSLGELYYPFFGNANLKAERNRSFEAGYDAPIATNGLLSLTYFSSHYHDLITFDPTTFVSENIGRVRTDGLELGLQQPLTTSLYAAVSYTYLHRAEDEATGLRLQRRPKHSGSLSLGWRAGNTDTNVVVLRTGARPDSEATFPFARATNRAYTLIDANVQVRIGTFTPFVKVENLADSRYEEVRGFASPRRRAIVGLRFAM
ncbi:MAG: TonB-dependent receptor [Acidobacteriota bacterium]|nr:TonB-dependent receptor [Acidobacteriota bacterium]